MLLEVGHSAALNADGSPSSYAEPALVLEVHGLLVTLVVTEI